MSATPEREQAEANTDHELFRVGKTRDVIRQLRSYGVALHNTSVPSSECPGCQFHEALDVLVARLEVAEAALFECAKEAGVDTSDGVPTWPPLAEWAVRAVKELRMDYDAEVDPL